MRDPVHLDDDGKAELDRRSGSFLRSRSAAARCERDGVALEHERRLVLGERPRAGQQVAHVGRRLILLAEAHLTPAGDVSQGPHRVAGAPQQRQVELARQLLESSRRVGAVHRHACGEHPAIPGQASQRLQRELTPVFVGHVPKLRQVGEGEEHVVRARLRQQLERSRVDDALVGHRPGIERVAGVEKVRELGAQVGRELRGQRLERDAGRLRVVCEQGALATGLRHGCDARPARPTAAAEYLEGLDELVEVLHLDRSIAAQDGRERAHRADERSGVRQGRSRGRLGAAHLEADDRLAGGGARGKRIRERGRPAHGLEKEPDRACAVVHGEEVEVVGCVRHGLATRRDDAAHADAPTEREERVRDRARLAEHGYVTGCSRLGGPSDPGGRPARSERPHAVRAQQRRARFTSRSGEAGGDIVPCRPGFSPYAGYDEGPHTGGERVGQRVLHTLVVDEQEGRLGDLGQVGNGRVARQPVHLVAIRVHAPRQDAASQRRADGLGVTRGRTDDRDRAREEERAHAGHRRILS